MDEVTDIEQRLRQALRHKAAPDGFTRGVMKRLEERRGAEADNAKSGTLLRMSPVAAWWYAAAAVLLLTMGCLGALHTWHQQELQRMAAAEAQVDQALQLTNRALNQVTVNLNRSHAGRVTQLLLQVPQ